MLHLKVSLPTFVSNTFISNLSGQTDLQSVHIPCRLVGLRSWRTDELMHWWTDALVYWCTDTLMHWCTDALIRWYTDARMHEFISSPRMECYCRETSISSSVHQFIESRPCTRPPPTSTHTLTIFLCRRRSKAILNSKNLLDMDCFFCNWCFWFCASFSCLGPLTFFFLLLHALPWLESA
jgi:hypothetical protein